MKTSADPVATCVADDDGLSLVEVIVAITILGVVMAAASLFFVNALKSTSGHSQRQQTIVVAQQAIESAQAVKPTDLLDGRTKAVVDALVAGDTGSQFTGQDVVTCPTPANTCPLNYDPSGATAAVIPTTTTQTVAGQFYTIRTFINGCYLDSANACGRTITTKILYRVTVDVSYITKSGATSCKLGCDYSLSTLVDPSGDPQFKTNISTPDITSYAPASFGAGASNTLVIQGTGFIAGTSVIIASGGGTFGTILTNTGSAITLPYTAGTTAGSYKLSVISPDGGRDSLDYTVNPAPTITSTTPAATAIVAGSSAVLVVRGANYVTGAQIAIPGATVGATTFTSSTQLSATVTFPAAGGTFPITVTNPDYGSGTSNVTVKSVPTFGTVAPSNFVLSTPTTFTANVTGLQATGTLVVSGGSLSGVSWNQGAGTVSGTYAGATRGPVTLTLTNADGGAASTSLTVYQPPTVTGLSTNTIPNGSGNTSLTIQGSDFVSNATVSILATRVSNGTLTTVYTGSTAFLTSSGLTFSYPNGVLARNTNGSARAYTLSITVTNPDGYTGNVPSFGWTVT